MGLKTLFTGVAVAVAMTVTPVVAQDMTAVSFGGAYGAAQKKHMVDPFIKDTGINVLFVVGGDGSQRGAHTIAKEASKQGYELAVVGIPKTIDNDIHFVFKTFGFDTAVAIARSAIDAAHVEAKGNPNGIGLVKVMGRDSGFIAAYASLASVYVNFDVNSAVIRPESDQVLADLFAQLLAEEAQGVSIVGHTSTEGSVEHNLDLSEQRAQAVVDDLIRRGFDAGSISATGEGESQPLISPDKTETARELNRRVEIACSEA